MSKYNIVELTIENGELIDFDEKRQMEQKGLQSCNVIYIYKNTNFQNIYIGQTTNFLENHKKFYLSNKEMFKLANFNQVLVIVSIYFHKSALDDVENQLIEYFSKCNDIKLYSSNKENIVLDYIEQNKVKNEVVVPLLEILENQKNK